MILDLLIFDCDGTLVDSEYLNNLATCELLAAQGLPQYDMDYALTHFVGHKFSNILADITEETGHIFPENISSNYINLVRKLAPQYLKTIDGAEELVAQAAQNTKICVASNGQRGNVILSLEMAGLKQYFSDDHIFTGTDVQNAKPAPDVFLLAAKKMDAPLNRAVVIEDSVSGVTGAAAAGMTVFGFTGTHHNPKTQAQSLKNAGATEVYESLIHIGNKLFA